MFFVVVEEVTLNRTADFIGLPMFEFHVEQSMV